MMMMMLTMMVNVCDDDCYLVMKVRPLSVSFLFRTSGKETDRATPLRLEKYGRIDFSLGKPTNRGRRAAKSRSTCAKGPWELVATFFGSLFKAGEQFFWRSTRDLHILVLVRVR